MRGIFPVPDYMLAGAIMMPMATTGQAGEIRCLQILEFPDHGEQCACAFRCDVWRDHLRSLLPYARGDAASLVSTHRRIISCPTHFPPWRPAFALRRDIHDLLCRL